MYKSMQQKLNAKIKALIPNRETMKENNLLG